MRNLVSRLSKRVDVNNDVNTLFLAFFVSPHATSIARQRKIYRN